ncbi:hypothetical protein [Bacillus thuringiensis]|uniref:hypothetical protein n=1 Tax=Bacillus thuringiensis TaxID=1428 RepID=UPI000BEB3B9F|nr:hypothetical protein [Bacillus thuringiensis]PEC17498.1 hypothetical protein CON19_07085 [Bacillus thuringiensis]PEV14644.1 hypothetical protein CN418_15110 [Bacillus thuringiensis]PGV69482.1 hypothetical protein COD96_12795 [Bacillus thuringiensis]PGW57435.1 hypothetical protein COE14_11850 [Bacillus thuringiensis]
MEFIVKNNLINLKDYRNQLARFNIKKKEIKDVEIQKLNSKLNHLFANDHIFNIYDFKTGAVYFSDEEWELIEKDGIKQIYSEKYNGGQNKYILHTNNGVLLRGVHNYYFHISKQKRGGKPDEIQILSWEKHYLDFLNRISVKLEDYIITNKHNLKLVLSILDHMRDFSIQLCNIQFFIEHEFENCMDTFNHPILVELERINCMIIDLVINNKVDFPNKLKDIQLSIRKLSSISEQIIYNLIQFKNPDLFRKVIRIHRETDNFWENYIGIKHSIDLLNKDNKFDYKKINLIGVLYGGLEVTLLAKILLTDSNAMAIVNFINYRKDYLDRITDNNDIMQLKVNMDNFRDAFNIILDDNILTGKTIKNITDLFVQNSINIDKYIILRHPDLNRLPQMEFYNSFIDLDLVERYFVGLIMPSPYTKIKEGTNIYNEFLDELGIFTLSGYKFAKYLYKNGVFEENTEISFIRDFFKGDH